MFWSETPNVKSGYLRKLYHVPEFVKLVDEAAEEIQKFRNEKHFDAIAFTGCSGAGLAYPVSYKLGIPLLCVRKAHEHSHASDLPVEGHYTAKRYLILDDFINSGNTITTIRSTISKDIPDAVCVGIALWKRCKNDLQPSFGGLTVIGLSSDAY